MEPKWVRFRSTTAGIVGGCPPAEPSRANRPTKERTALVHKGSQEGPAGQRNPIVRRRNGQTRLRPHGGRLRVGPPPPPPHTHTH